MDTSDIATLNDALGSAGVDLRVRFITYVHYGYDRLKDDSPRPRKRLYSDHTNSTKFTGPMKTAAENNHQNRPSTLNF